MRRPLTMTTTSRSVARNHHFIKTGSGQTSGNRTNPSKASAVSPAPVHISAQCSYLEQAPVPSAAAGWQRLRSYARAKREHRDVLRVQTLHNELNVRQCHSTLMPSLQVTLQRWIDLV